MESPRNASAPKPSARVTTSSSLAEILAPLREDFRRSGMTDQERERAIDEAIREVRNLKQAIE